MHFCNEQFKSCDIHSIECLIIQRACLRNSVLSVLQCIIIFDCLISGLVSLPTNNQFQWTIENVEIDFSNLFS